KAYTFWVNTVSNNASEWTLEDLFRELFNYCFSVDYRLQMCERLRNSYQGSRSVREYVHELENLFLLVGFVSERERVDRLWHSLNESIQRELWKKELTPMSSSWAEVREATKIVEIA
ncbi:hypothetical protein LXA43DRAFT_853186, partial [Ganoderma leucocontextum]